MAQPVIRLATLSDLSQLIELRVLMQAEVHQLESDEGYADYEAALRRYFEKAIVERTYVSAVAAVDGGQLVAATGLVIYDKPPSIRGGAGKLGYVSNVFTRTEWRGQGLATRLMELLVKEARGAGLDRLHLGATESGVGVYERVGFKPPRYPQFELNFSSKS